MVEKKVYCVRRYVTLSEDCYVRAATEEEAKRIADYRSLCEIGGMEEFVEDSYDVIEEFSEEEAKAEGLKVFD